MARQSIIDTHPDSVKIIEMIAAGVPAVDINRRYPEVSVFAISRYKIKRSSVLSNILDTESPDLADVIGRLADLADSARIARRLADASTSPQVRARSIAAELAVLDRLANRLGLDDLAVARQAQATKPLVLTLQKVARKHPGDVLDALADHQELADLRDSLRTTLKRENGELKNG